MARRLAAKLTRADLLALTRLALTGNIVYYILLSMAVHAIGIAPASLIIGVLPLTVTLMGRPRPRRGAVAAPSAAAGAGGRRDRLHQNVDVFVAPAAGTDAGSKLLGLASAVGALACWTWFAVENARYLKRHHHFDGNEWSLLWGLVTGALGAMLWGAAALLPAGLRATGDAGASLGSVLARGPVPRDRRVVARQCAVERRIEAAAANPVRTDSIVFETLFALVFGFVYAQRTPRWLEIAAIVLLVAGVSWSVREHSGRDGSTPESGDNLSDPGRSKTTRRRRCTSAGTQF